MRRRKLEWQLTGSSVEFSNLIIIPNWARWSDNSPTTTPFWLRSWSFHALTYVGGCGRWGGHSSTELTCRTSVSRAAIPGFIVSDAVRFRSAQHALVAGLPAEHVQKKLLATSSSRVEELCSVLPVDHPPISHSSASILANPR